ncbi:hypothetical protein B0H17DRAFT_1210433 [Mycena rosella]|uniref:Protein kinase domain-containing protein n=1 Tax=Mycena rosella TaxID=1033263 RepID=A0AAD7G7G5_MYCRO|nr:hypothetical protein B0H17DRAFT_1210433 [Mycena rosella]
MGVITYFLLAGYTPFNRDAEMDAIIAGNYRFGPAEYWANMSDTACDFVLEHKWLASGTPHFVPEPDSM